MFRNNVGTVGEERRHKTLKSAENQLTTMLLLVTTLFLILLLTTYIRFIYAAFVISDTPSKFATSMLIFEISYKLYVTNSGINFFLYCICGQKFRSDLKIAFLLLCGLLRRLKFLQHNFMMLCLPNLQELHISQIYWIIHCLLRNFAD